MMKIDLRDLDPKFLGYDENGYIYTVPPGVWVTLRLGHDGSVQAVILEKRDVY